jgi:hypothetical protein
MNRTVARVSGARNSFHGRGFKAAVASAPLRMHWNSCSTKSRPAPLAVEAAERTDKLLSFASPY